MMRLYSLCAVLCLVTSWYSTTLSDGWRLVSEDLVHSATRMFPFLRQEAELLLNETLQMEAAYTTYMKVHGFRSSGSFKLVQSILGATPQAKQMSYGAFMQVQAMKLLKAGLGLNKKQFEQLAEQLPPFLDANRYEVHTDDHKYIGHVRMCPYPGRVRCDFTDPYRSHDGSCNNKENPLWGSAFQPFARLIPPDYGDGIDLPRTASDGGDLPSARLVSLTMHDSTNRPASVLTHVTMLIGQFIDHDLSRTAVSMLSDDRQGFGAISDVRCGADGCMTGDGPFSNCLPIRVPAGDPLYQRKRCLHFVRTCSVPSAECPFGHREQLNQITAYLDASNMYGSIKKQADTVRDLTNSGRGRMKMRAHPLNGRYKQLLPAWEEFSQSRLCKGANETVKCFLAGDGRVNEHLGLMCLHTLFSREHNRVEGRLHRVNPHWSGDRLFAETRRIMGAMWQSVIYREYLPAVLGPIIMKTYGLHLQNHGYYDGYDPDVRADVANSFATAAFRFGHSQIQDVIQLMAEDYSPMQSIPLSSTFRSPAILYQARRVVIDDVMRGFVGMRAQAVDSHITTEVAGRLFSDNPPEGFGHDLPALNVQRAREHGIPGYVKWREWCGLGRAYTFSDLDGIPKKLVKKLAALYRHVEDIDLFPAGLAERPAQDASVGPTFACILANQFQRARNGDRFWHENRKQPRPFTPARLREIRKMTLAKVICENSDSIHLIQPKVLLRPFTEMLQELRVLRRTKDIHHYYQIYNGAWNERVRCETIPDINLSFWREMAERKKSAMRRRRNKKNRAMNRKMSNFRRVLWLVPHPINRQ